MKKVFLLATAAFLVTGFAFAHDGDGKKPATGKTCCKDAKDCKKDCCKKDEKKDAKATKSTAKATTTKSAAKA